jgi:phosphatidate phosphatase APP1
VLKAAGFRFAELTSSQKQILAERARWMFVNNKRGRSIAVTAEGRLLGLGKTKANGRLRARLVVKLPPERAPSELSVTPVLRDGRGSESIPIHFLAPEGVSVISDIDDTIRVSNVADRQALLRGTFAEPFEAVPRMAGLYRAWAGSGAHFHYVSATPWQLYVPIAAFIEANGFPKGTFHLKDFRWRDRTVFNLFAAPDRYKRASIEPLLKRLPRRRFALVGDSGQRDPEAFGDLARRYPHQVAWIFIRDLSGSSRMSRYRAAFEGIRRRVWSVFTDPATLPTILH